MLSGTVRLSVGAIRAAVWQCAARRKNGVHAAMAMACRDPECRAVGEAAGPGRLSERFTPTTQRGTVIPHASQCAACRHSELRDCLRVLRIVRIANTRASWLLGHPRPRRCLPPNRPSSFVLSLRSSTTRRRVSVTPTSQRGHCVRRVALSLSPRLPSGRRLLPARRSPRGVDAGRRVLYH